MNITPYMKTFAIAAFMAAFGCRAEARQPHRYQVRHSGHIVVVQTPVHPRTAISRVSSHFGQKERLAMVIAYLRRNQRLTTRHYVRMTRRSNVAAEAELDAFASDRNTPIHTVFKGKKKFYSL